MSRNDISSVSDVIGMNIPNVPRKEIRVVRSTVLAVDRRVGLLQELRKLPIATY